MNGIYMYFVNKHFSSWPLLRLLNPNISIPWLFLGRGDIPFFKQRRSIRLHVLILIYVATLQSFHNLSALVIYAVSAPFKLCRPTGKQKTERETGTDREGETDRPTDLQTDKQISGVPLRE